VNLGNVVLVVLLAVAVVGLASGMVKVGSRASGVSVAAEPPAARGRLADLVEENGMLRAEVKALRREWEDFSRSWEKRWGTVTRGMRREDAAAAAAPAETPADDPAQLEFTVPGPVPVAAAGGARRRLQPVRMMRQG